MSLTANTSATAAAVDTTVITKRYSGEMHSLTSGTSNLTLYTCPQDKLAYIYFQSLYFTTTTSGTWHLYVGNPSIQQTGVFLGTILHYSYSSGSTVKIIRLSNNRLIATNQSSTSSPSVGLALNDTVSTNMQYTLGTAYTNDYTLATTWSTAGSNNIQQEFPPYVILNPNNQLKYSHTDSNQRHGVWNFIVEEHAYVAPT